MDKVAWNVIDQYFKNNSTYLVDHHLDSYNIFIESGIKQIFKDNNPQRFRKTKEDDSLADAAEENEELFDPNINYECKLYFGGKNADKIYFGKPILYDDDKGVDYPHYMYPNDARLRSITYGFTIHYDLEVEYTLYDSNDKTKTVKETNMVEYKNLYLGKFPLMVNSKNCILNGLSRETKYQLGECRNDTGGYFIINGKEKVILSQEKFADNMLYVRKNADDDIYSHSCEVHSVSEDTSKQIRYTSVKIVAPSISYSNLNIVVDVPNVKKPVPLFILMRALGIISDKQIIEVCLLDLEANKDMMELFIPSIHDAHEFFTQQSALEYISQLTKRQTISSVQEILMNYMLPHIGEDNYINKAYFIGFMVYKILRVYQNKELPTDRDNFKFKRVDLSGTLMANLFREYYLLYLKKVMLEIDTKWEFSKTTYKREFTKLVEDCENEINRNRILDEGIRKGFKGNWGATDKTKKIGIVQDVNRLSWFTYICHMRKITLPLGDTSKVVAPHLLHSTQWGVIDPVDTPDGANVGIHKHLSISTVITSQVSSLPLIKWIRKYTKLMVFGECSPKMLANYTKVFVNGNWLGVIDNPIQTVNNMKICRRNGILPIHTSITFSYDSNIIYIYTDSGRLTRPIFFRDIEVSHSTDIKYGNISYYSHRDQLSNNSINWLNIVSGFLDKPASYDLKHNKIYQLNDYPALQSLHDGEEIFKLLKQHQSVIEYLDTSETEHSYISLDLDTFQTNKYYTHCEIDPSLMLGVMGNSIIFPETNQFPRDCFSCGQSRQAVSLYHSNFQNRMDKMGVVLNYGQVPLVKSRYLQYINNEEQPYGFNAMVAIMTYTGYNVEDAILINEGSINRGMFRTTYYTTYEAHEESAELSTSGIASFFTNVEEKTKVSKIKEGYDYAKLDENGLVKENTKIDDRIIIIGQVSTTLDAEGGYVDKSTTTKKGQLGYVDKAFVTEGEEGTKIAKVRIREERIPAMGDKFASRSGQKGTIGLVIPEKDMPFNEHGIKPDLIINPHALPSRMTIGQLVECLFGKACSYYGAFGDCTIFSSKGSNFKTYGEMLTEAGYHNSGTEVMYSGFTGEQLEANIYFGPTYYMRLKHMVKDKVNYRATGKRSVLTRQTNEGRANDGGLRLGEMERDGVMGHGMSNFLQDSFMVRGDQFMLAICNKTGMVAIYNYDKKLFLSPFADGPLVWNKELDGSTVLNTIPKYGTSFSLIKIPYAFKLYLQELFSMGIQLRIITDVNIEQFMNLTYNSGNLKRLMFNKREPKYTTEMLVNEYLNSLKNIDVPFDIKSNLVTFTKGKYNYSLHHSPFNYLKQQLQNTNKHNNEDNFEFEEVELEGGNSSSINKSSDNQSDSDDYSHNSDTHTASDTDSNSDTDSDTDSDNEDKDKSSVPIMSETFEKAVEEIGDDGIILTRDDRNVIQSDDEDIKTFALNDKIILNIKTSDNDGDGKKETIDLDLKCNKTNNKLFDDNNSDSDSESNSSSDDEDENGFVKRDITKEVLKDVPIFSVKDEVSSGNKTKSEGGEKAITKKVRF